MRLAVLCVIALVAPSAALADDAPPVPAPVVPGPVPGADAITIKTKPSAKHCGGVAVTAKIRVSRRVPKPDAELAALFALEFPKDLDFDPKRDERRQRSTRKFNEWFARYDELTRAVDAHYRERIGDKAIAEPDRLAAIAHLTVAMRWSAAILAHAEIPKNVREYPEAMTIYCDTLADKVAPMHVQAEDAAATCRTHAATISAPAGWWVTACAPTVPEP